MPKVFLLPRVRELLEAAAAGRVPRGWTEPAVDLLVHVVNRVPFAGEQLPAVGASSRWLRATGRLRDGSRLRVGLRVRRPTAERIEVVEAEWLLLDASD